MIRQTSGAARRLSLILAGMLILAVLAPVAAQAQTPAPATSDVAIGVDAIVTGADGGFALLRTEPRWDSAVLTSIPESTVVAVTDGPLTAEDGSVWFAVIALDQSGFLPKTLLLPAASADPGAEPTADEATATDTGAAPIPTGEMATIAGTSDEGARCRVDPSYAAEVITVLYEGELVALTGPATEEWQPLICADVQGYVHNDFVLLDGEAPLEAAPIEETPVTDVPTDAVPTEEVPVTEVPVEEVPVTEAPVEEIPVTEVPVEDVPVVEAPVDEVPATDVPAEEVPVVEEPVEEVPATEAPVEEAPVVEETPVVDVPVEEVPTEAVPATEVPTDVIVDEVPTEVVEAPVEDVDVPEAPVEEVEAPTEVVVETVPDPAPVATVAVPAIADEQADDIQQTFTAAIESSAADATGYGVVVGTNGDGVRCRISAGFSSSIISVLAEGSEIALRGAAKGEWQPVVCARTNGFIHVDYLGASDGSGDVTIAAGSDGTFTAAEVTGTAVVSGTGGGGLRCRTTAGYSGTVLTVVPEGSKISLNGSAQGEWQPVVCAGQSGYVHVDYVTASASNSKTGVGADTTFTAAAIGTSKVTGTNGDGVRCRATASYSGSIITVVSEGATVTVRGNSQGEWTPVVCAGKSGFIHKDFLGAVSSGGGTSGGGSTSGGGTSIGTAKVTGTGGGGLRCRSSASMNGSIIVVIPEGSTVTLRGAVQGEWQPVVCGGQNGFVHMSFVTKSSGGSTSGGTSGGGSSSGGGGSSSGSGFAVGSRVVTGSNLNLRYEPNINAGVAAIVPSGTVLKVTGNRTGFVSVSWDGLKGWVHKDYVSSTTAALSKRGGSGTPTTPTNPGTTPSNPSQGSGNGSIVSYALQYVGYPYVWAGEGPYGFDCSGFVMYVIKNVLGKAITHDMFVQYDLGTPVSRDALQPGDIVFFQNTFRWGMSHNGIYIGDGKFVHAENESTGVVISDINSQYYSSRYYGAVRFT